MKLRGIEFGCVFNASGARNFFGDDAWWFHKVAWPIGLTYRGCTFVSKTTTLMERAGNMPLEHESTKPKSLFPPCIIAKPFSGNPVVLNKVGLSGPGMRWLLDQRRWQARTSPFLISIMAVEDSKEGRLAEIRAMAEMLAVERNQFAAPFGLQVNFSCPNVGHKQSTMVGEVGETLDILARHLPEMPIIPKFNAMLQIDKAIEIGKHPACDAIVMGNTIPWGEMDPEVHWAALFGSKRSPLAGFGRKKDGSPDMSGGGLSGAPLYNIHKAWIILARAGGFKKPIVSCGGILRSGDPYFMHEAGASAIELGSVSILRPHRVQSLINEARKVFA